MSASITRPAPRPSGIPGRAVALLAAAAQIVAMFQPWTAGQRIAADVGLLSLGDGAGQPTVGVVLVALAGISAVPALVGDATWPRLVSGIATGALVLVWLGFGPAGHLTVGVALALGAAVGHLVAAALATGAHEPEPDPEQQGWDTRRGGDEQVASGEGPVPGGAPRSSDRGVSPASAGHRLVSHTADIIVEAWGQNRAACFGEAVRGLVSSFADTADVAASERHETVLEGADNEDLLVDILDEVIFLLDARGLVPVGGNVRDRGDGALEVTFDLADVDTVRPSGAVPKATTYHELEVTRRDGGWFARAIIDV